MNKPLGFSQIFEHSNARYLDSQQLADEFVWTQSFEKLLSNSNHVVLGSRGSGKTALVKMLSHECLSRSDSEKAKNIIAENGFIATYIPLKVSWVNSIKSIDSKDSKFFQWSLNLTSCARFIDTMRSCLNSNISDDIDRIKKEFLIAKRVSKFWFSKELNSFRDLENELEEIEYFKNVIFNKSKLGLELTEADKAIGLNFNVDLFLPLVKAKDVLKEVLNLGDNTIWCVCIDEAEFLTENHHKVLNSYMRSFHEFVFKITTMPYRHYTLETNVGSPLNVGHDFHYIYVDKLGIDEPNQKQSQFDDFAENLFNKRIKGTVIENQGITLKSMLGVSSFIEKPKAIYDDENFLNKIKLHFEDATVLRAIKLKKENSPLYQSSIVRKYSGLMMLRDSYSLLKGNMSPSIYSGKTIVVRCSDGNPRRLLRMFNFLLSSKLQEDNKFNMITYNEQGTKLRDFSYQELSGLNHEIDGKKAFDLIMKIGIFFKETLHSNKLKSNYYSSIRCGAHDDWNSIEKAVDLGLLYPDFKSHEDGNMMPNRSGTFVFANCLTPYFYLMPRKGKPISLSSIFAKENSKNTVKDDAQISLNFDDLNEEESYE